MSISSPKDKVEVKNAIIEISNSKIRIEAENDNIKAIKKRLKDEFELDTKMVNALTRLYHNQQIEEFKASTDEVAETYEEIFG